MRGGFDLSVSLADTDANFECPPIRFLDRFEYAGGGEAVLTLVDEDYDDHLPVYSLPGCFRRGDCDGDGIVSPLVDSLFLLLWEFVGGLEPMCLDAADVDDDGEVLALVDTLSLLLFGFSGGEAPPDPGPDVCGVDPTDDDVTCEEDSTCP